MLFHIEFDCAITGEILKLSDKQKPRALSLQEVSERTGIPLNKLQEQQAARQAQIQQPSQVRIDSAGAGSAAPSSRVDEQPSWYSRLKDKASGAFTEAANFTKESVAMVKDLGAALENSGTEESLSNQRIRRMEDSMKP